MKGWLIRCVVVGSLAAAFAAGVSAESLGEAAKRERERRAKLQAEKAAKGDKDDKPAKTYSESDLQNARGEKFSQATGPAIDSSAYTSSSSSPLLDRPRAGGSQAPASGGSVASLEQRVRDLERQRASLPPGPFGASVACTEGVVVRSTDSAVQLKNSAPRRVCDPNALRQQEAQRVQAQLDQARAALERARR